MMTPDKLDQLRRFARAAKQGGTLGGPASIANGVLLLCDEVKRLTAERDADRAEVVQLCQERLQLKAERDEARAGELAAARNEPGHALPEDRDHAIVAYFRLFLQWRHQRERADQAEAALARVRALHSPHEFCHCTGCGISVTYPCPTIAALDGSGT